MTTTKVVDVVLANLLLVEAYHLVGDTERRDWLMCRCKHTVRKMNDHQWRQEQ
jgi:hypothetical protein